MNCNLQGNLAEAEALKYFVSLGYEVYLPFGTASTVDMIVCNEEETLRVSVKSTSLPSKTKGKWRVNLSQNVRDGRICFKPEKCDLVFVYIVPEDRIIVFDSKDIKVKTELTV
jgi:hypothetical protein